jgi:hypothetical protein
MDPGPLAHDTNHQTRDYCRKWQRARSHAWATTSRVDPSLLCCFALTLPPSRLPSRAPHARSLARCDQSIGGSAHLYAHSTRRDCCSSARPRPTANRPSPAECSLPLSLSLSLSLACALSCHGGLTPTKGRRGGEYGQRLRVQGDRVVVPAGVKVLQPTDQGAGAAKHTAACVRETVHVER